MGGVLAKVGSYAMDPFNSFGTRSDDTVYGPGSTVSNPNGPSHSQSPEEEAAAEASQRRIWEEQQKANATSTKDQFMAGMLGSHGAQRFDHGLGVQAPPPPPSQWAYVQGKGPAWQTPERTINREGKTPTEMNWKMTTNLPGSSGFNSGGNRF